LKYWFPLVIKDKISGQLKKIDAVNTLANIYEAKEAMHKNVLKKFGKEDFNFVSVCYEKTKRKSGRGAIYRYVHVEIDDHYRKMLKFVEHNKQTYLNVELMEQCLLKDIYQSLVEGVKHSGIHFIARKQVDELNDILIYSSMATTNNEDFSVIEKTTIKLAMDSIRAHSKQIEFEMKITNCK